MYDFVSGHDCPVYLNLLRKDQNSYTFGGIVINAQAIYFQQLVPSLSSHQSVQETPYSIFVFCQITITDEQLNLMER